MKVRVDYARCMSTGVCAKVAPAVFQFDVRRKIQVLQTEVGEETETRAAVERAAARCPRRAIILGPDA